MEPAITVVETDFFLSKAKGTITGEERAELVDFLARRPDAGVVIPDSGGVRKLRWSSENKGKRGGVRVIYFFHSLEIPIFLLSIYAKARKSDLSHAERKGMKRISEDLVDEYRKRAGRK